MNSFLAGALAGLAVDITLYPIDTVKTRVQSGKSPNGPKFTQFYNGIGSILLGSVPASAIFFLSFDMSRPQFGILPAAIMGEFAACSVRIPIEIVKQRMQVSNCQSVKYAVANHYKLNGFKGFYRGAVSMLFRDVPFACIQYPLYMHLKDKRELHPAGAGALSGGVSALLTTPLDVAKTRVMVCGLHDRPWRIIHNLNRDMFTGVIFRTMYISIGGLVYFVVYETAMAALCNPGNQNKEYLII